jgi:hypothetical protein
MIKIKIGKMNTHLELIHYNAKFNTGETELQKLFLKHKFDYDLPWIDRYHITPHYLNIKPFSTPLQSNKSFNMTFEDCCNKRAIDLFDTGKVINLFWSGGLDSTAALIALTSNCKNKDQLKILTTYGGILESGYFYDTFLKNKFNTKINIDYSLKDYNEKEVYLHGGNGNSLFTTGSMLIDRYVNDPNDLKLSYKKMIHPEKYEFVDPVIKKSPRPIITYEDFLWLENFVFKWDHARFELLIRFLNPKNVKEYLETDKFNGFYYTKEFEQWVIDNNEQQHDIKNFWTTTKLPIRKYLSKQLGKNADDYVNNKRIQTSMFLPFYYNFKYITSDFEVHYNNE